MKSNNRSLHDGRGHYHKPQTWRDLWLERVYEEYAEKLMWLTVGLGFGLLFGFALGRETKRE